MNGRFILVLSLVILPTAGRADRIYLENGNSFEDVVLVSHTESQVRFRVASGEMSLPTSWVARVERAPGALEEFLERQQTLASDPAATAEAWLELARWARARGLGHGFRDALVMAAELGPGLEALPPLMARIGYHLNEDTNVWTRGRPRQPVAPGPAAFSSAPAEPRPAPRPRGDQEIAEGLTRAIETLAEAELERSRRRGDVGPPQRRAAVPARTLFYPLVSAPLAYVSAGWFFPGPGPGLRPPGSDPGNPVIRRPANPDARALLARPPGSLLPVSAYRR